MEAASRYLTSCRAAILKQSRGCVTANLENVGVTFSAYRIKPCRGCPHLGGSRRSSPSRYSFLFRWCGAVAPPRRTRSDGPRRPGRPWRCGRLGRRPPEGGAGEGGPLSAMAASILSITLSRRARVRRSRAWLASAATHSAKDSHSSRVPVRSTLPSPKSRARWTTASSSRERMNRRRSAPYSASSTSASPGTPPPASSRWRGGCDLSLFTAMKDILYVEGGYGTIELSPRMAGEGRCREPSTGSR